MNIKVTVANTTKESFEKTLRLIFLDHLRFNPDTKSLVKEFWCVGYKVEGNELLLSNYSNKCTPFAYKYNEQQTIDFAWGWWLSKHHVPTEPQPDTDGSTKVAYLITTQNENCGFASKDWGMFVSIKPVWFIYGK